MNDSAAGLPVPVRWIDREAVGRFDAADDPAADPRRLAKILIGITVPGLLIGTAILLMLLISVVGGSGLPSWHATLFVGWWLTNVGVGYFLFFQWAWFVRRRRLCLTTPGLWRVSALYFFHLMSLVIIFLPLLGAGVLRGFIPWTRWRCCPPC